MDPAAPVGATIEACGPRGARRRMSPSSPPRPRRGRALRHRHHGRGRQRRARHAARRPGATTLAGDAAKLMKMPPDHIHALGDVAAERKAQRTVARRRRADRVARPRPRRLRPTRAGRSRRTTCCWSSSSATPRSTASTPSSTWSGRTSRRPTGRRWSRRSAARLVFVNTDRRERAVPAAPGGRAAHRHHRHRQRVQRYETVFPRFFVAGVRPRPTPISTRTRASRCGRRSPGRAPACEQFYRQRGQLDRRASGARRHRRRRRQGRRAPPGPTARIASRTFFDAEDDPARAGGPALSELISRRNVARVASSTISRAGADFMRARRLREAARRRCSSRSPACPRRIRLEQQKRS